MANSKKITHLELHRGVGVPDIVFDAVQAMAIRAGLAGKLNLETFGDIQDSPNSLVGIRIADYTLRKPVRLGVQTSDGKVYHCTLKTQDRNAYKLHLALKQSGLFGNNFYVINAHRGAPRKNRKVNERKRFKEPILPKKQLSYVNVRRDLAKLKGILDALTRLYKKGDPLCARLGIDL